MSTHRRRVAILGATGMVGQRLVERLTDHPWFEIGALAASERSAGKPYGKATTWRLPGDAPAGVNEMPVVACHPDAVPDDIRIALSALDSSVARQIEGDFRAAGFAVISNAASYREDPDVPLVIPEVNPEHLALIERQGPGFIVTNPNCSSIPLTLVLKPLIDAFGVEAVCASTWQAVSGAGYPGESSWDMVGNVHPHAGNEEIKMADEPLKMLGGLDTPAALQISARCVRVPVADGHLVSAQIRCKQDVSPAQAAEVLRAFQGAHDLPSSPSPLIHLLEGRDRPSPRFDSDRGGGMAVSVGRIESCPVMGLKLFCLAHNTIRGAAGAAVANLELLQSTGRLPSGR
jgi:aspartate-semialdehyde dehydrogenase